MRSAIIVDDTLPQGLLANAVACMTTGLFHGEPEAVGPKVEGADCTFIPITKIAILVFKKAENDLHAFLGRAKQLNLKYMLLTREGQSTTSYEEYIQRVQGKSAAELTVIGIGVIGDDAVVKEFSKGLQLLK
jgi:hypothetical protein